jgi:hypothetical protein
VAHFADSPGGLFDREGQVAEKHDKVRQKLLELVRNPARKAEFHDDKDIGRIVKKLSQRDLHELSENFPSDEKTVRASCPPGTG